MKFFSILMMVFLMSSCSRQESHEEDALEIPIESSFIVKSNITRNHFVPAVFMAVNRAELAFQLSGTVDRVLVKIGQNVEVGQAMMSVYNPNIDPALDSNFAKLESLKAQIDQVKSDVGKLIELRKNNSTSKTALEQKQTDLKDLKAQQKLIQSQINLALANQSESIIKAPFSGSIISVLKQTGEFVQAGEVVLTIFQEDEIEVEVNITKSLWENLNLGDLIKGQFDNQVIDLELVELSQTADPQSHLMKIILRSTEKINNAIGQLVILSFPQVYQDVYQLPLETVVDDGINKPYIFIVENEMAVKNPIIPLYIENGNIIFHSKEDIVESVILKGQSKLSSGMKVKVL